MIRSMDYVVIITVALFTSALTLFSGFGLGTLLMPAFAFFFPIEIAVALTAVVHLLNNIFKFILLGKHTHVATFVRFGMPAILAAFVGAALLNWLSGHQPLWTYTIAGRTAEITLVKSVIAALMLLFALLELFPFSSPLSISSNSWLTLGGLLSGFFGGLSGHQGALRAAFLIKAGLSKEAFIATSTAIGCLVDITRLFVYSTRFASIKQENLPLLTCAVAAAFIGALLGKRLMKKITLRTVQRIVATLLILIALALAGGII